MEPADPGSSITSALAFEAMPKIPADANKSAVKTANLKCPFIHIPTLILKLINALLIFIYNEKRVEAQGLCLFFTKSQQM